MTDPLRDQLAANCDCDPTSEAWERAQDALRDYDEAKARGETPQEHIRNAMMLLQNGVRNLGAHALCLDRADYAAIWARLEKAVVGLEAVPTPQEEPK